MVPDMLKFEYESSGYQMYIRILKIPCNAPANNYMFKVNNRNTRARFEICSKLTIKIPDRCQ